MAEEKNQNFRWKDVGITPDTPLLMIVDFMNVLNQRLATVENIVSVPADDGKIISLTDYYAKQAEAEQAKQAEQAKGE